MSVIPKPDKSTSPANPHSSANVFTIPPGKPFLPELVSALCDGTLINGFRPEDNPLVLPQATIFLPSRRAARELAVAFLEASDNQARFLPVIRTLGDADEEPFGLVTAFEDSIAIPPILTPLERKLTLSVLVERWVNTLSKESRKLLGDEDIFIPSSQADAMYLAEELCKLLDEITREECGWESIQAIIPQAHAKWWELTGTFLAIIMEQWPELLEAEGCADPGRISLALLNRRIENYTLNGSPGPVIVAGSTGSVPSTRRLLKIVSQLPNGAIVLPGLDTAMAAKEWEALSERRKNMEAANESHPQFGFSILLENLGINRNTVIELGMPDPRMETRSKLVNTALALPRFASGWKARTACLKQTEIFDAFENVSLIEAGNERQEALAIALALREILTVPGKSAALVTPDRNLAHRVAIELGRFGIEIDDSAGLPFTRTVPGQFLRQILQIAFTQVSKADLTSLLKSPLLCAGLNTGEARAMAEDFELQFLRGVIGNPRAGNLADWIRSQESTMGGGSGKNIQSTLEGPLGAYLEQIDKGFLPLAALQQQNRAAPLKTYIEALLQTLQILCVNDKGVSSIEPIRGFHEFIVLVDGILTSHKKGPAIFPRDFPAVFDAIMAPLSVRSKGNTHPRLHIYGPLEVRLLDYDKIVLGGLNEGTWPASTRNDAFLNRLMRHQVGLSSPERRTGLAAHDFQQLMGTGEVILSYASRVDKAPTITSRWVQRLLAVLGTGAVSQMRARGAVFLSIAKRLEESQTLPVRKPKPDPRPPVSARPESLPVTDIETWIRDPYALYAKRILELKPLEPLERDSDPRLIGTLYHSIMEHYTKQSRIKTSTDQRLEHLLAIAQNTIRKEALPADVETLALIRFKHVAEPFIAWESKYFEDFGMCEIFQEIKGETDLLAGSFRLYARADRIDIMNEGSVHLMDYKTGTSPSVRQAKTLSPQLVLEGAIARAGGFGGVPEGIPEQLAFVRLRQDSAFSYEKLAKSREELVEMMDTAFNRLEELITAFRNPSQGYVSRRAPFRNSIMDGPYDHLARVREWHFGEGDEDA